MTSPEGDVPRWVLDTNVVLSALVRPGGTVGRLRLAWQAGLVIPLASRATTMELMRVLAYPRFKLTPSEQHELLSDYLPWAETVKVPAPPPPVPACRDADDMPFLELAIASHAQALVTGDADLRVLAPVPGLDIITPAQAIERISI